MKKDYPQLIPLILTRHESSCRKAYEVLEPILKKAGFLHIEKFELEHPHFSQLNGILRSSPDSWILVIDICNDFLIFDYAILLKQPLSQATMFLGYQNPSTRTPYIIQEGWAEPLSSEAHRQWIDHYSTTGAYMLPAKNLAERLQAHPHNNDELLSELCKPKGQFVGLALPSKPIRLAKAEVDINSWSEQQSQARPCLFLDRDGVVIEDSGYVYKPQDLKIIPDILPIIRWAKEQGWLVIIISNQSGIARKKFSLDALEHFTALLKARLQEENAEPDHWYYCPFHIEGLDPKYSFDSVLRKPAPGMILQATNDYPISIHKSFMIGDRASDAIPVPGLRTLLIRGQYPLLLGTPVFDNLKGVLSFFQELESQAKP